MKLLRYKILAVVCLLVAVCCPAGSAIDGKDVDFYFPSGAYVSKTKYNWTDFAAEVTANCVTKEEKAEAIYRWLCDHIAYDTPLTIYTADEAIEQGKGVCQAYSELFYRIGTAAGLDVEIVHGDSKDIQGKVGDIGHAWNVINFGRNRKMLVDATWGAGALIDGDFVKNEGEVRKMAWYDVDPKVMITSHYPSNNAYQYVRPTLSESAWQSCLYVHPLFVSLGFSPDDLYARSKAGTLEMPEISGKQGLELVSIPPYGRLRTGEQYSFRVKNPGTDIVVLDGSDELDNWQPIGNDVYELTFIPKSGEPVCLVESTNWLLVKTYDIYVRYQVDGGEITSSDDDSDGDSGGFWAAIANFFKQLIKSILALFS